MPGAALRRGGVATPDEEDKMPPDHLQPTPEQPAGRTESQPHALVDDDDGDALRRAEVARLQQYELERAADEGMIEPADPAVEDDVSEGVVAADDTPTAAPMPADEGP